MGSKSTDGLAQWLADTQDYSTNEEALNRISGSVNGLNIVLRDLNKDTLFWTEPSNLELVLTKKTNGDSDE